ncbi:MAG: heme ABC transporter ATP-binding protein [Salinisphaera sp.]|nr:heme ABC transporter ATP-binding protein [Salinisphaera sp.]
MLIVDNIRVTRDHRCLLDGVSLRLAAGELMAVIGPNGAGKSSLLHAIVGDLALDSGRIDFAGQPLAELAIRERACRIALLAQASLLAFPFRVREVVTIGRSPHASGRQIDGDIVAAACAAADIGHLVKRPYTHLSGGEKQRVQLARVLAQVWRGEDAGDRLLLLDEPVAALDLGHQQQIMREIGAFARRGVAVMMVLHDVSLAARHADRLLALRDGAVIAQGTPAAVVTADTMTRLFDIQTHIIQHPESGTPVVLHS